MIEPSTCGEIVGRFVQALGGRPDLPPIQIIGGNGSAALLDENTVIDLDSGTMSASAACDLPRVRADGSVRDVDTLVLSTSRSKTLAVQRLGERTVRGELKVSAFGLKTMDDLERQRRRPIRSTAKLFLADRYVSTAYDGHRALIGLEGFKALFPFQVPFELDALETFELAIGRQTPIPTSHPGATILNYLTRSVSGLRAKDRVKVETMAENVLSRYPEVKAWIHDGPGRPMLDLARILHTLSEPRRGARTLHLGTQLAIEPFPLVGLSELPAFMLPRAGHAVRRAAVEVSHLKSLLLARFESNNTVVAFWRRHIEDRIDRILHNDL